MRKFIGILLLLCLCVGLCACDGNSNTTTKKPSSSANNSYITPVTPTKKTLSTSEKEEIAEREAHKMIVRYMVEFFPSKFSKYNIDATRVSTGSIIEKRDNYFCVYGKLYLYDKYGNLKDIATFEGTVDVYDDGSCKGYLPQITIE